MRSVPCWLGNLVDRQRDVDHHAGNDQRNDAEERVLGEHAARREPPAGQAGKGKPLQLDWSIRTVRSLPVIVSVELEPLSPGEIWLLVITPSISTFGDAVDGGHDDHAHEQQGHAAGQQEQDLQRRLLVDTERQLEAAVRRRRPPSPRPRPARRAPPAARVSGRSGPIMRVNWTLLSTAGSPARPAAW